MLTPQERKIVEEVSGRWTGPNTWGWRDGYRLSLREAIAEPGFG